VPPMRVAVVIVNANAGPLLARTLEALGRQTIPPARTIVIDNASVDGSADGLEKRFPGVEVVRSPKNLGFAAANNLAVEMASDCDWVALLNPDAFAEPAWLASLERAAAEHPGFDVLGSRLLMADEPHLLDGTGDIYHVSGMAWRRDHGKPVDRGASATGEVFSACGAAALYRRTTFLEAGGFDESFFCYYEDTDLAFRLRLAGHRVLYVHDAVVHHVGSATSGRESEFTIFHAHRNCLWTFVKNMPAPLLWLYLPRHVVASLFWLGWFATRGRGRALARSKVAALRELPRVLAERRTIQARRVVGCRELRRTMARGIVDDAAPALTRAWKLLRA
jgi:GT2 family glycosyltransferase